jgi:FKBP-type peptidyl-prolyl cis-trans isomerase SlyD
LQRIGKHKAVTLAYRITGISDGRLTVDGSHPLAGQTVTFHVTVGEVRDATPMEIAAGRS